jgi:hypothetical protein
MAIRIANSIKATLLQLLVATLNGYKIHLFKNNLTPTDASVIGDFTEADFTGYASQNLTTFATAFLNGANQGETDAGLYTFTQSGSTTTNNIYGYYVTTAGGALVYSERNPNAPVAMTGSGLQYVVDVKFMDDSIP